MSSCWCRSTGWESSFCAVGFADSDAGGSRDSTRARMAQFVHAETAVILRYRQRNGQAALPNTAGGVHGYVGGVYARLERKHAADSASRARASSSPLPGAFEQVGEVIHFLWGKLPRSAIQQSRQQILTGAFEEIADESFQNGAAGPLARHARHKPNGRPTECGECVPFLRGCGAGCGPPCSWEGRAFPQALPVAVALPRR